MNWINYPFATSKFSLTIILFKYLFSVGLYEEFRTKGKKVSAEKDAEVTMTRQTGGNDYGSL